MIKNYFKIAWRNLLKNKGYSVINILGLSIGMAVCLLIMLFVQHERSYDQYHAHANRIYRADIEIKFGNNHLDLAVANPNFGETAKNDIAAVEDYARIRWYGGLLIKKGNENIRESHVAYADNALFSIFSFPFLDGDPKTALTEPNTIVINESIARKYFNSTQVVGKTLTINDKQHRRISGVIKDIPENTHFQFRMFVPMFEDEYSKEKTWAGSQNYNTYLLAGVGTNTAHLHAALKKMLEKNLNTDLQHIIGKSVTEFESQGDFFKVSLMPLPDIHLHSNKIGELYGGGNPQYVYVFSAIALFILVIACINFMNLATARMSGRAREVGLRKSIGALRSSLIVQFLSESMLTAVFSMALAVGLALLALPVFNELAGKQMQAAFLTQPTVVLLLAALTGIVGILAGAYPAFYFSAFQPVKVLKGAPGNSFKRSFLRNGLVVFQFAASIVLIVGTIVIYQQMDYIRKKDIGYNREQMLVINNTGHLGAHVQSFKDQLLAMAGVKNVTVTGFLPTSYYRSNNSFFPTPGLDTKEAISMQKWDVDENYITTMNMKIIEGRNFDKTMGTDSNAVIINEAAAKFLGNKDILNKLFYTVEDEETRALKVYRVIGVVKDFNFSSLRDEIKPLALLYGSNTDGITVRLQSKDLPALISQIKDRWTAYSPGLPFEYSFMDEDFNTFYKAEEKTAGIFTAFAVLALFIGCMGLFGLATFTAEQRTKEIGVRKVLGAGVPTIVALLSKDFLKLVFIAIVIAGPVAYYFMSRWLADFAYRIDIEWWVFAVAGSVAVLIALLTVGYQSIKSALMNPVKALRTE
ncbi:MAG: ABC transporter permease [Chitinophagaceae bacterium]|nr:ABC transporter permease [Chitinophagaceae bacterium]MCW5926670.1 ABC transporter permease [Chitinophagaceae bacterium]